MQERGSTTTAATIAVAVSLALPVMYFGSYAAMFLGTAPEVFTMDTAGNPVWHDRPIYRFGGRVIESFYQPAHSLDGRMKSYWNGEMVPLSR